MLWASLWGMPLGFIDFFLVPTYWNPDSLFGLMEKYGVGIGGRPHFWLLLFFSSVFLSTLILFPSKAVYNFMIACAFGAVIIVYLRRDLWKQVFFSAFALSFFYLGGLVLINSMFKGLIENFYNFNNTWGILIFGIPLEEAGAAFFAGAFWSTIYEYTKSYREKKIA